jgi:hypothetical protein
VSFWIFVSDFCPEFNSGSDDARYCSHRKCNYKYPASLLEKINFKVDSPQDANDYDKYNQA